MAPVSPQVELLGRRMHERQCMRQLSKIFECTKRNTRARSVNDIRMSSTWPCKVVSFCRGLPARVGVWLPIVVFVAPFGCSSADSMGGSVREGTSTGWDPAAETDTGEHQPHREAPRRYSGMFNPLDGLVEAAEAGQPLYDLHCAGCHGAGGAADGPWSATLDPPVAPLHGSHVANAKDDYLYYRIAEGGAFDPFNSSMPGYAMTLGPEQIWQVVTFLRVLSSSPGPQ